MDPSPRIVRSAPARSNTRASRWPRRSLPLLLTAGAALLLGACATSAEHAGHDRDERTGVGDVIFIHPDGASAATWAAGRAALVGPDADLEWDKLPAIGVYRGHLRDSLTGTSNGGGTVHATGVKVFADAFGNSGGGDNAAPLVDETGAPISVAQQALARGIDVALVQSGTSTEPGTGCFLASVPSRQMHDEIAAQLIESGACVILGGGERWFLPAGATGVHGEGRRADGRNLIAEAQRAGYRVVYTREQLLGIPAGTTKLLGVFAEVHTFNALPEERLREEGLPHYWDHAPTVGEMTAAALRVLRTRGNRFLLVVEEEGTDNFGNNNNAAGTMEAMRRADEAFGVARRHLAANPDTLVLTAADSDGGGMRLIGIPDAMPMNTTPPTTSSGAPIDGVDGTTSPPFVSAPDRFGNTHRFVISWIGFEDVTGGVLVRADGLNSSLVTPTMDNTDIAKLIRRTLFGG